MITGYDWKKQAAQATDDSMVERAFMDQAYQFLANKASTLMKDPHRLGFEVVSKNDKNTRMVGIFAFRVGDNLLYVPVFFLNGEIKGSDLLYRHDTKTFVPLTEDWVKYIISKTTRELGRSINKKDNNRSPKSINLRDIAYPPNYAKSASVTSLVEDLKKNGELLKRFILEDGGLPSIEKIASWMSESFEFSDKLVKLVPEECWMPPNLGEKIATEKSASVGEVKPTLILSVGGISALDKVPEADRADSITNMSKKGYDLWDDRDPKTVPVYKSVSEEMTEAKDAGMYKIIMMDGSYKDAFVAAKSDVNISDASDNDSAKCCGSIGPAGYGYTNPYHMQQRETVIVFTDGSSLESYAPAFGQMEKDLNQMVIDEESVLKTDMSAGSTYRIFDPEAGTMSEPVHCVSSSTKAGIKIYKVYKNYSTEITLRQNEDLQSNNLKLGQMGKDIFFIKIDTSECKKQENSGYADGEDRYYVYAQRPSMAIGSSTGLKDWVLGSGIKEASILVSDDSFSFRTGPRQQTPYMPRVSMAVKLAADIGIHAAVVEELLDEAVANGKAEFLYDDTTEKSASYQTDIRFSQVPAFRTSRDPQFNVDMDTPQSYVLRNSSSIMSSNANLVPKQRVGDAYDPGMGKDTQDDGDGLPRDVIMNSSPEQLAQYAQNDDVPHVFEHGLVGTLVQTFDSVAMVDKYLPDMEEGLDRLGRILFLIYWKPRDFEDAYGSDDMTNLENQILSNFKSYGELVLDLTKKSDTRRRGTVSFAGE